MNLKRYIDAAVRREVRRVFREDGVGDQYSIMYRQAKNIENSPALQQALELSNKLERLTNHYSGELPNLYSQADKLSNAIYHGDLTSAHSWTTRMKKELIQTNNSYRGNNPDALKKGFRLIEGIRACLAKAGF